MAWGVVVSEMSERRPISGPAGNRAKVVTLDPRLARLIGSSPAFVAQVERLHLVAGCDSRVLITGETGTGKELFAQAIHYLSARASKPYVAVNCGAIPAELAESELFGHVRGAYTSATHTRKGLVAEADGGTLFLDDVDCLPPPAQATLLRVLQEGEFRCVGSNLVHRCDLRVVAASNCDLLGLAQAGHFRKDLYYRLSVLRLALPALRDRREDIPVLARHFLRYFAQAARHAEMVFSAEAERKLLTHQWPGNVRELQHAIERVVLLASGSNVGAQDLELDDGTPDFDVDVRADESFQDAKARCVERFERSYIERLLTSCVGNVARAAREAKKNRRAFFALMQKHGISADSYRGSSSLRIR